MSPRIIPFILYMAFVGVEELLRFLSDKDFVHLGANGLLYLYPVKVAVVGLSLVLLHARYSEVKIKDILNLQHTAVSVFAGLLVFLLWVNMDWPFAVFGTPQGYDPSVVEGDALRAMLIGSRLLGAVVVVPVMEELFWRSFLMRYIINPDFGKISLGTFTWGSFFAVTVLFGLEHNLWLAGMMAGAAYNLLIYYTRSIAHCIVAHAVTNLALGIYVLQTARWQFW